MLTWKTHEPSGQLYANSEKCELTRYWVSDGAWNYTLITKDNGFDSKEESVITSHDTEEAKSAAQEWEDGL